MAPELLFTKLLTYTHLPPRSEETPPDGYETLGVSEGKSFAEDVAHPLFERTVSHLVPGRRPHIHPLREPSASALVLVEIVTEGLDT